MLRVKGCPVGLGLQKLEVNSHTFLAPHAILPGTFGVHRSDRFANNLMNFFIFGV